MEKVWELYSIARKIIEKLCNKKCFHYGNDKIEDCQDYIARRLENNNFQALKNYDAGKGAKASTYLHIVVSSRIIDFFNSAAHKREFSDEDSISNSHDTEVMHNDYSDILDPFVSELTFEEQTYLQYRYNDEMSYKEIAGIFGIEEKQASKKVENIQKKLKRRLDNSGYDFKDII